MTNLEKLVSTITADHVFIQTHNYPDPDALASALGLQELFNTKGIKSTICYKGRIDKYNTVKMIEVLQIYAHPIKEISMSENDEVILVDSQKGCSNVDDFIGNEIGCIDHHSQQTISSYLFQDIRENVGACSTIIALYFKENNVPISTRVATALLYGLKMDTISLSRDVSDLDIDMFAMLYKRANISILKRLETSTLQLKDLTAYSKAISELRIYNSVGISNIGNGCSEAIIGAVSDFLLTLAEVTFSLVYSYRAGGVKFSVRSELTEIDASKVIKSALSGIGDGGGHPSMAAGFVSNISSEKEAFVVAEKVIQKVIDIVSLIYETAPLEMEF